MFSQYLRIFPKGMQLSVFLSLWAAMMLLVSFALPIIITSVTGIDADNLETFYKEGYKTHTDFLTLLNVVGAIVSLAIPALLFAYLAHPKPLEYLGLIKPPKNKQVLIVSIMAVALMFTIGIAGTWLQQINMGEWADELQKDRETYINAYFQDFTIVSFFKNLLFIAFIPAVTEELFFRGIVQKFAYSYVKKPGIAILIPAFLFALVHFSVYEVVPIFWAGIVLGWVYYITSSLWLSILLHFVHNGIQVAWLYISKNYPSAGQVDNDIIVGIIVFSVSSLLLIFSIKLLHNNKTPLPYDWSVVHKPDQIQSKEKYD